MTRAAHATSGWALALTSVCLVLSAGCGNETKVRTVEVNAFRLQGCPPDELGLASATLELSPLGDFSAQPPALMPLASASPLTLPEGTLALSGRAQSEESFFNGYGERGNRDDVALLLWPERADCNLDTSGQELGAAIGRALGHSPSSRLVLIAGGDEPSAPSRSVAAVTFDTGSGVVAEVTSQVAGDGGALSEPRAHATVTAFGSGFLVAGGENPLANQSGALPVASKTADVFDPLERRFAAEPIDLDVERSRHSSLLMSSGETLLVGGRDMHGTALTVLEAVSPITASSSIADLVALKVGRLAPAVLRLDDDRIFVGGGSAADGEPLAAPEWLAADARTHLAVRLLSIPARYDRAFVAMPGGGVLAVGGCQISETPCGGDCRAGCPPPDPIGTGEEPVYDAWWIDAEGAFSAITLPGNAPRPVLLGGADGRPLLALGDSSNPTLYRFNPWQTRFEEDRLVGASPPRAGEGITTLDGGAAVWFSSAGGSLYGMRWSTRERFAIDSELLEAGTPEPALDPFPLVPDRPPGEAVQYDPARGELRFLADSPVGVYVGASSYENVVVELSAEGPAPRVVLGTKEFGGPECPWPEGGSRELRLQRDDDLVRLSSGGLETTPCAGPSGRVRLGIRGGDGKSTISRLSVERRD